jgi:hypothetical protein
VAVFVLAAAVIGLFAMMGELASRVINPDEQVPEHPPHPLEDARLGAEPAEWPSELAALRDADVAHLLVFGSTCTTCGQIASGATGSLDILPQPVGVVVSSPLPADGAEFIARHPLVTRYPHLVDAGGTWVRSTFGIDGSPSVLVFERGRLASAHSFTSAGALGRLSTSDSPEAKKARAAK